MIQITETESLAIVKIIDEHLIYEQVPMVAYLMRCLRNRIEEKIAEYRLEQEKQNEKDCD
jgi:hypothetical protein